MLGPGVSTMPSEIRPKASQLLKSGIVNMFREGGGHAVHQVLRGEPTS